MKIFVTPTKKGAGLRRVPAPRMARMPDTSRSVRRAEIRRILHAQRFPARQAAAHRPVLQRLPASGAASQPKTLTPGDQEDLKTLKELFARDGKAQITRYIREGRIPDIYADPSTGDRAEDIVEVLAEHILCSSSSDLSHQPPFCIFPGAIRVTPLFEVFRDEVVRPAFDEVWKDIGKGKKQAPDFWPNPGKGMGKPGLRAQSDIVLFAMNLYGEAGNETPLEPALKAVAHVVLNRMKCSGRSSSNVILNTGFSWTTITADRERAFRPAPAKWMTCLRVAFQALGTGYIDGGVGNATYYYSDVISAPTWAIPRCFIIQIGHHRFYALDCLMPRCPKA